MAIHQNSRHLSALHPSAYSTHSSTASSETRHQSIHLSLCWGWGRRRRSAPVLLISEKQVFCVPQLPLLFLFIALIVFLPRRRARAVICIRHFSIQGFCIFINRIKIGKLGKCFWGEMIQWNGNGERQSGSRLPTSCGRPVAHGT